MRRLVVILVVVSVGSCCCASLDDSPHSGSSSDWEHCYYQPISNVTLVHRAFAKVIPRSSALAVAISLDFSISPGFNVTGGTYRLEIWEESSGRKVRYKGSGIGGSYDICCGFLETSRCIPGLCTSEAEFALSPQRCAYDCPLPVETMLTGSVSRPIFASVAPSSSTYEVKLQLFVQFDGEQRVPHHEEDVCVIVPFQALVGHHSDDDHALALQRKEIHA